jgi:hypothetical protein
MVDELQLFRGKDYQVNEYIIVHHPTLEEICDFGEKKYFSVVSSLCATPSNFKWQLFDSGVDYEKITEFELFSNLITGMDYEDSKLLFNGLDLTQFLPAKNRLNGEIVLYNEKANAIIDNLAYNLIVEFLRDIHGLKKKIDIPGNEITKKVIIDMERTEYERLKNEPYKSYLIPLISSMINCEQFKYNHETVWKLPIYTFLDSVRRIQKIKNYNLTMQGIYAGNVDFSKVPKSDLDWMGELKD